MADHKQLLMFNNLWARMLALPQVQYTHAFLPLCRQFLISSFLWILPLRLETYTGLLGFSQDFHDPFNHFLVPNWSFS